MAKIFKVLERMNYKSVGDSKKGDHLMTYLENMGSKAEYVMERVKII